MWQHHKIFITSKKKKKFLILIRNFFYFTNSQLLWSLLSMGFGFCWWKNASLFYVISTYKHHCFDILFIWLIFLFKIFHWISIGSCLLVRFEIWKLFLCIHCHISNIAYRSWHIFGSRNYYSVTFVVLCPAILLHICQQDYNRAW